ncbi:hypothetical protein [Streptomyces sp. NPDC048256]|uniref:hypothetical protein n=1 Tax=unclassified Streptomyces TaxID=2593676 RepID=UPI0033EB18FE
MAGYEPFPELIIDPSTRPVINSGDDLAFLHRKSAIGRPERLCEWTDEPEEDPEEGWERQEEK